jgi:hypothetical protein
LAPFIKKFKKLLQMANYYKVSSGSFKLPAFSKKGEKKKAASKPKGVKNQLQ